MALSAAAIIDFCRQAEQKNASELAPSVRSGVELAIMELDGRGRR
jgi:hypothetical protein